MHRAFLTIQLAIFSVAGLVALMIGATETVRYLFQGPAPEVVPRVAPGGSLATAIVFVPIWAYFLWAMVRQLRAQ